MAATIVVLMLVVIIGTVALTIDGGLLWVKFRQLRSANDAAALAAAQSCAKSEGQAAADTMADTVAVANVADAVASVPNVYTPSCNPDSGQVEVRYRGQQELMFGPAVGVSSPKDVEATAIAAWGGAGGSEDVIPLVLMKDRLSTCNVIPEPGKPTPPIGTECGFWWDNDALGNATWGLMSLRTWGTDSAPSGCSGSGLGTLTDAITDGIDQPLYLLPGAPDVPTYVCAENGHAINPIDNAIGTALANGRTDFAMPVNSTTLQVSDASGDPYKYAIIAFAFVRPVGIYKSNGNNPAEQAGYNKCAGVIPPDADSNSFCLVVTWQGYSYTGLAPGGGPNFGLTAITLSG